MRSVRMVSRRSSYASETYFRKTRPRITSLYWLADSEPRSLSAAFHRVSLSSFIVEGASGSVFFLGGISACFLRDGRVDRDRAGGHALDEVRGQGANGVFMCAKVAQVVRGVIECA